MRTVELAPSRTQQGLSEAASLPFVLALHLAPGLLIFAFYRLASPIFVAASLPPKFALLAGFALAGLPLQVYLLSRATGGHSPRAIWALLPFRERLPRWQFALLIALLFLWAVLVTSLLGPSTAAIKAFLAQHAPFLVTSTSGTQSARSIVLGMLVFKLVVDGLITPVVEESYFRGLLLPSMSRLGAWGPLANAVLFTVGHFWQPENYPAIFCYSLALAYVAWWKRNFLMGLVTHALLNTLGTLAALAALLT